MIQRKFIPILAIATVVLLLFLYQSAVIKETWRGLPQKVGLGEKIAADEAKIEQSKEEQTDWTQYNPKSQFKYGESKPMGYNFTMRLVITKIKEEDTRWLDQEIPDIQKDIYVADDPNAPLHPPKNKGHEVMVYLTWIIDHYEDLPDVALFMHAHRWTWHNNELLGLDSAEIVKRLNPNRVWREGYQNLRCSWGPGCPDWMHPGETEEDLNRPEQTLLAKSWSELFPLDRIPDVLAQPCCAQFALSSERIRSIPLSRFVFYRDWLLRTQLPDHLSGRIWEYVWQYVFTGQNVHCPAEYICYCDGYGLCFGGKEEFDEYNNVNGQKKALEWELNAWKELAVAIEEALEEGRTQEAEQLAKPEEGKDVKLVAEISKKNQQLDGMKKEALKRGEDPKIRAEECGREWHEGDGF